MKNLSFKEWFKLKEVMVGQTPEDKAAQDEIDKAIIDAGAGTGVVDPKITAQKAVSILQKNPKFIANQNKQLINKATLAAAAKKPTTKPATGANTATTAF